MAAAAFENLLDLIYESAAVPELWPGALEAVAGSVDGAFGSLFMVPHDAGLVSSSAIKPKMQWVGTPAADRLIGEFAEVNDPSLVNSRMTRAFEGNYVGFFNDLDLFAPDEIGAQRFYTEFLWPRGYGWFAGTLVRVPTGDAIVASVERHRKRGPFERGMIEHLDLIRPHLARASLLSLRLGLTRARAMTDALERVGLPAAVVNRRGRLVATNRMLDALEPEVVRFNRSCLSLANARADVLLQQAFNRIDAGQFFDPHASGSIPVPARANGPATVLHVVPVCGTAHDIFAQADAIVVATAVEHRAAPTASVLQGLFDLTPREAGIARLLGNGETVNEVAATLRVSPFTVRAHVRAILSKTGVERQADLVGLLAGASFPMSPNNPP